MAIKFISSPNYDKGRKNNRISKIVVHWFGAGDLASAVKHFQNDRSDVSAHYLIENDDVVQMVRDGDTAWHAGNYDVNLVSIGIEHSATPDRDASELTYQTSSQLIADLASKYSIPVDREHIIQHKEVKPTACPGSISIERLIELAKQKQKNPCEELEKKIEEVRESRDNWKKKTQEAERTIELQTNEIVEYRKQIESLQQKYMQADFDGQQTKSNYYQLSRETELLRENVKYYEQELAVLKAKLSDDPLSGYSAKELIIAGFNKLFRKG